MFASSLSPCNPVTLSLPSHPPPTRTPFLGAVGCIPMSDEIRIWLMRMKKWIAK